MRNHSQPWLVLSPSSQSACPGQSLLNPQCPPSPDVTNTNLGSYCPNMPWGTTELHRTRCTWLHVDPHSVWGVPHPKAPDPPSLCPPGGRTPSMSWHHHHSAGRVNLKRAMPHNLQTRAFPGHHRGSDGTRYTISDMARDQTGSVRPLRKFT